RILNIVFGSLITFLGVFLNQMYWTALHYPETAVCVIIDLPFKGKWIASGAGATALTNHHDRISSQKYAVDIIKFGDRNKLFKNDGIANEDSYTFGAEVISDRKSTRLNSSHVKISYAVFRLKKKIKRLA